MPINILMPALSPTMEKGNLSKWLKKEGDAVKAGDVIAEIETDKATMEYEAVDEGTIGKILVPEGSTDVAINQPIAILLTEGEDAGAISEVPSAPAKVAAADQKADEKTDAVQKADAVSDVRRTVADVTAAEGKKADIAGGRVFASPLARRLAKETGIDLSAIKGSGPHGRVVVEDVKSAASRGVSAGAPATAPTAPVAMSDSAIMKLYQEGSYEIVPHDNMRKVIAKRLVEAKGTIPHFYLTVDTELDALLALRAQLNDAAPKGADGKPAWKISVNDMVIKGLAVALQRVPDANVTWTEGGMLRHTASDIGVAVSIPGGLITPVVRNAEKKRISEIATEMKDLAGRARQKKLAPSEYQGGTSAVSNLGMFGVKHFGAIINPPHASILAVGAGVQTPVVRDGKVEIRTIMTCTLSVDHRAVDGALGAELLAAFKELIENPASMLA